MILRIKERGLDVYKVNGNKVKCLVGFFKGYILLEVIGSQISFADF